MYLRCNYNHMFIFFVFFVKFSIIKTNKIIITMSKNIQSYLPFQNKYKKKIILNYGRPYTNYTTYNIVDNKDNITTIYIDNQSANYEYIDQDHTYENTPYYVEIHYSPSSNSSKFETILFGYQIDTLIEKYDCKQ